MLPAGLAWKLNVGAHLVELSVVAGLAGDYNGNGIVDAADYSICATRSAKSGAGLLADGNHNNMIDPGDYDIWKSNFGMTSGSGAAASAPVPEPNSLSLGFIAAALCGLCLVFDCRRS